MHKLLAVIRREFLVRVRTRVFLIGTVLGPLLMGLLLVFPMLLEKRDKAPKRIAVLDAASGNFGARVEAALVAARKGDDPAGLPRYEVHRIAAGEGNLYPLDSLVGLIGRRGPLPGGLDGVLLVTDAVLDADTIHYYGSNVGSPSDMGELQRTLRQAAVGERLGRAGVDPLVLARAAAPIDLATSRVSDGRITGQSGEASFVLAYVMSFLLYIALLLYGTQVMTSVLEEKSNRIMEVLVSSLSPFQLMLGKVIGVGLVGLLQLSIWAGTATLLTTQRAAVAGLLGVPASTALKLPIPEVSGTLVAVFLLFFVLGFFLYAAAYAAVGASCNTLPEAQQAAFPVTMCIAVGLILLFGLLDEPNGSLARTLSLVPLFAPFVTPVRHSLSPLPITELALSAAITVLGMLAVAWVAARIYRVGILMHGKRASLAELWRWVRTG